MIDIKNKIRKEPLNTRTQLLIIIIPIAIIPLIIIINIVINRIFVHLERQSKEYYSTIIEQVANNLNFIYNQYARTLSNMIEIPEVVKGLNAPPYRSKEEERIISNNIIGDINTRGGLRNTVEEKIEGAVFIFEMDRKSLLNNTEYKIHYVSSANIGPSLKDIMEDPLYEKLKENKEKLIFGRFKDYKFPDGKDRAVIIFPYYKEGEESFTKFILITLFPDFIPKFYNSIKSLNYGTLYILDRFNNILSQNHPGEDDLYSYDPVKKRYYLEEGDQKSYDDMSFKDYSVLNTDENILNTKIVKNILERLDNEETVENALKDRYYITYNNIKYLIVVGFEYSTKCKFVYFHPVIQIQRPIYNIISVIVIITIFIVIIVVIISLILSKTFTNPIMKLSDASLKIAKGDYDVWIKVKATKEINLLTEAFNKMVKEIKEYTNNLERLVEERTKELKETHEKLQMAHKALWGEMELAKKIQISLLPESPSINGYDIAAKMIAAKEVGGDFYDITTYNNRNLITVGDVSGHGVTPGLITMIIQTIISSIMTENSKIKLKDLYVYLNNILMKKIKKLDVRMFVTISILEEDGEGNFKGCGKHNDILIYRRENKNIEIIETKGIWLGITEDIKNYICEYKFSLNKGDIILLYTDGLSEVSDSNGSMYFERLKDLLIENSGKSADEILDFILKDFEDFKEKGDQSSNIEDDVTLIVIKRV